MEHDDPTPVRPRRLRALPTTTTPEVAPEALAPVLSAVRGITAPRSAPLDALLKDVDDLRASVRRDLGLAATAVEAGEEGLAAYLLSTSEDSLTGFADRASARLEALPVAAGAELLDERPAPQRRTRRMMPAAPLVAAAAALFVSLAGSLPQVGGFGDTDRVSASGSLADIARLADSGASPELVSEAAAEFHASMAPLLAQASTDPAAAQAAIDMLTRETAVLRRSLDGAGHPELRQVLAEAQALVTLLKRAAKKPAVKAPTVTVPVPEPQPAQPKAEPKPSASAKPASPRPTASPKPSSAPTPTGTPSPTPSASSSSSAGEDESNPLNPDLG